MQGFMIALLTCSVTMSAVALFYMAITPLLAKRYSERGRYYAWLIVVIGLIIPFRPQWDNAIIKVSVPAETAAPMIYMGNATPFVPSDANAIAPALPSASWWQIVAAVLLAGMVITIAYHTIRHYRFMKTTRRWSESITDEYALTVLSKLKAELGIKKQIALYLCSSVGSPMMVGFIRPRILLPVDDLSQDDFRFVIKHELVHYKRKDLNYKCLVLLATCIHWFNPIVYLMAKAINTGCELSCDAEIVRSVDKDARCHYSETIIGVARYQSRLKTSLSTNFYGGMKGLKRRVLSIMDTGKKKAGIAIICAALVITMGTGFAFAANAAQSAPVAQASNGDQQSGPVKWEPSPEYEQFGITYSEAGKMLFDGKMVRYFWDGFHVDANSYATRYDYLNEDGVVDIHTVRGIIDNGDGSYDPFGELLDIVAYSQREFDARNIEFLKNPSIQATASNDPSTNTLVSQGKTIALIFSEYSSYGITHVENSTNKAKGNVYYNGQLVKTFVNEKPDGGVFSFSSSDGGSITVYTVYDASGKLTGVKITEE